MRTRERRPRRGVDSRLSSVLSCVDARRGREQERLESGQRCRRARCASAARWARLAAVPEHLVVATAGHRLELVPVDERPPLGGLHLDLAALEGVEAGAAGARGRVSLWHGAEHILCVRVCEEGVAEEDALAAAVPALALRVVCAGPLVGKVPGKGAEGALPLERHRVDKVRRDEHVLRRARRRHRQAVLGRRDEALGPGSAAGRRLLEQDARRAHVREAAAPEEPVGGEGDPLGPHDGGADACGVWWRCDVLDEVRRLGSLLVLLLAHGSQHAGESALVRARRVKGGVLVAGDDEPLVARLAPVGERDGEGGDGVAHQLLVDEGVRVRLASEVGWLAGRPVE
mmetsp:Transcript_27767/g.82963  ORF Transcript_27767/g.82963 Transcript_27767/m.82963 type:complete len:343 (+) Transcript_27767:124-1152(+)